MSVIGRGKSSPDGPVSTCTSTTSDFRARNRSASCAERVDDVGRRVAARRHADDAFLQIDHDERRRLGIQRQFCHALTPMSVLVSVVVWR